MMKNYLLSGLFLLAFAGLTFGQVNVLDYETVTDPLIEPFDLISYESAVANPSGEGSVGKIVKAGWAFWGGINIYQGGDLDFSAANDTISIDFYTESTFNDTIIFTLQAFNRTGGVATYQADAYYVDANDTQVGVWKTLKYAVPDSIQGAYNQMVIFFGWHNIVDGDVVYFDNLTVPGLDEYGTTDVSFNVTDKFNNAEGIKLFIDGTEEALTQVGNVYSTTKTLDAYSILKGSTTGIYEIVFAHMAGDEEMRDTSELVVGSTTGMQEVTQLVLVEEAEDGTALAISVGETPPAIDGTIDEVWSKAKTHTLQKRSWWGSPTGLYSTFKIMWDIDNVYLLYTVEDATPYNGNTTAVYENDCMETFFDMNQSATTPYDADDWQIRTIRGLETWTGSANVEAAGWADNVARGQSEMADGAGYIIELAIPWTSLSATFLPIVGTEFNHDCAVADVGVNGGARLYRESWTTDEDIAYMNTSKFGTITLSDKTDETTGIREVEAATVRVYPNPATDVVTIESDSEIAGVRILDMTGRTVSYVSSMRGNSATINVGDLSDGVYLVSITDMNGVASVKKLRVL